MTPQGTWALFLTMMFSTTFFVTSWRYFSGTMPNDNASRLAVAVLLP